MSLGEHLAFFVLEVGLIALVLLRYKAVRDADENELVDEIETAEAAPAPDLRVQRFHLMEFDGGVVEVAMTLVPNGPVDTTAREAPAELGENEPYRMSPAEVAEAGAFQRSGQVAE